MVQQEGTHPGSNLLPPVWAALQALYRNLQQPAGILCRELLHRTLDHLVVAHGKTLFEQLVVVGAQGLAEQHCD